MAETTTEVRADIEQTRARMSGAIAELERKVDVSQRVREHPWAALAIAFGAGVALSSSKADVRAARAAAAATGDSGSKLGLVRDGVIAAIIGGVAHAFHSRVDDMVSGVVTSVRGGSSSTAMTTTDSSPEAPIRAD